MGHPSDSQGNQRHAVFAPSDTRMHAIYNPTTQARARGLLTAAMLVGAHWPARVHCPGCACIVWSVSLGVNESGSFAPTVGEVEAVLRLCPNCDMVGYDPHCARPDAWASWCAS